MTEKALREHQKFFKETKEKLGNIISEFGTDAVYNNIEVVNGVRDRRGRSRVVYIPVSAKKPKKVFLEVSTVTKSAGFRYPLLHSGEQVVSLTSLDISEIPPELKRQYRQNMIEKMRKLRSKLAHFNVRTRESQ
jgi:hypothetical protein